MARKKELRSDVMGNTGFIDLSNWVNKLNGSVSAENLTVSEAMQVSTFAACINFICDFASVLPIKLYKIQYKKDKRIVNEITEDSRLCLLNSDTGDLLNPLQLKRAAIFDYLTVGNSYIYINRTGNKINSLHYVDAGCISPLINTDPIMKQAKIMVQGRKYEPWDFIIAARKTKNGVTGTGFVKDQSQLLASAFNTLLFENKLVASGGNKRGFLQTDSKVQDSILDKIRQGWKRLYSGNNDVVVLNSGVKFQEISETSVEMQLDERKKSNGIAICESMGVPYKIFEGGANDDEFQRAIQTAVMPAVMALQSAINKSLLLESEKNTIFFEFDLNELNKGNLLKRYQAYKIALDAGYMTTDEVRELENMQPLGLDWVRLKLSDVFYNPETKEIYTPNTNNFVELKGGVMDNGNAN